MADTDEGAKVVEFAKRTGVSIKRPQLEKEFGVAPSMPVGSWSQFSGQFEARKDQLVTLDNLVEMRRKDGQARALMRLLMLPILSSARGAEWVAPPEETDESMPKTPLTEQGGAETQPVEGVEKTPAKEDQEVGFANKVFKLPPHEGGMTTPFSKVLREILLYLFDGFSLFEEVYYIPDDGELGGMVSLKKLARRDARTITLLVDKNGGFDGARQRAFAAGRVIDEIIPVDKLTLFTHAPEENPLYGVSMFEAAWHHYDMKKRWYYITHVAGQIGAVPGRLGEYPDNADPALVEAFGKALTEVAFNTAMKFPEGFKVTTFQTNGQFDYLKLIDHHDMEMAKSVLAKFLNDEKRQVLIEGGKNDASADFFVMGLEAIMNEIAETLTYYTMPRLIDWNFNTGRYPVFKFAPLTDSAKDAIRELFMAVMTAQSTQATPEFIRELEKKLTERLGLDVDYDEVDKREEEEARKAEEDARAQMEAFQSYQGGGGGEEQGGGFGGGGGGGAELAAASTGLEVTMSDVLDEVRAMEGQESASDKALVAFAEAVQALATRETPAPEVKVEIGAPNVHVDMPEVRMPEAPKVEVSVPEARAVYRKIDRDEKGVISGIEEIPIEPEEPQVSSQDVDRLFGEGGDGGGEG